MGELLSVIGVVERLDARDHTPVDQLLVAKVLPDRLLRPTAPGRGRERPPVLVCGGGTAWPRSATPWRPRIGAPPSMSAPH
jgi:hypothetical protein